jgi:hypothetical protein
MIESATHRAERCFAPLSHCVRPHTVIQTMAHVFTQTSLARSCVCVMFHYYCDLHFKVCTRRSLFARRLQMNEQARELSLSTRNRHTMRVIVLLVFAFSKCTLSHRESDCSIHNGVNTNYFCAWDGGRRWKQSGTAFFCVHFAYKQIAAKLALHRTSSWIGDVAAAVPAPD